MTLRVQVYQQDSLPQNRNNNNSVYRNPESSLCWYLDLKVITSLKLVPTMVDGRPFKHPLFALPLSSQILALAFLCLGLGTVGSMLPKRGAMQEAAVELLCSNSGLQGASAPPDGAPATGGSWVPSKQGHTRLSRLKKPLHKRQCKCREQQVKPWIGACRIWQKLLR